MTTTLPPFARLQVMTQADLNLVLAWRNHPRVRYHMYTQDEISFDEHVSWFERASVDPNRSMFILKIDDESLGYVTFYCDDTGDADWGFYLAPEAPKGTGKVLGVTATNYAFEVLGLKRLWGEVLPDNHSSQNFHTKQGFVLEEILLDKKVGKHLMRHIHRYLLTKDAWWRIKEKLNGRFK